MLQRAFFFLRSIDCNFVESLGYSKVVPYIDAHSIAAWSYSSIMSTEGKDFIRSSQASTYFSAYRTVLSYLERLLFFCVINSSKHTLHRISPLASSANSLRDSLSDLDGKSKSGK